MSVITPNGIKYRNCCFVCSIKLYATLWKWNSQGSNGHPNSIHTYVVIGTLANHMNYINYNYINVALFMANENVALHM
jgi:hypothetical protein